MQQSKKLIIIIKLNRITKNNIPTARIALCDRAGAEPGGRLHRNHPFPGQHQRVDGGCGVRERHGVGCQATAGPGRTEDLQDRPERKEAGIHAQR